MPSKSFKKDAKKHLASLLSNEWIEVLYCLTNKRPLPEKYRDHALSGDKQGFRDCHIKPDLILIYAVGDDYVQLTRLGSHAELF